MKPTLAAVSGVMTSWILGGCDECQGVECKPCPQPVILDVVDEATGEAIPGVVVTGAQGWCDDAGATTLCQLGDGAGTYELAVEAEGYETESISVSVPRSSGEGCCDCGYEEVHRTVELTAL